LDADATKRKALIEKWKTKHKGHIIDSVRDEIKKHEIPIILEGKKLILSSGEHNLLIKQIVEVFIPSHFPNFEILYVGDTKNKEFYLNKELSKKVSYTFNIHDKLPDVMAYSFKSKRLLVIESVTSVGPVEESRKEEIKKLVKKTMLNVSQIKEIIYVTSFLDASAYGKFSKIIAYGTYVWIANRPKNLISYS
jgi:adenine-specific DNA-methyltransferase